MDVKNQFKMKLSRFFDQSHKYTNKQFFDFVKYYFVQIQKACPLGHGQKEQFCRSLGLKDAFDNGKATACLANVGSAEFGGSFLLADQHTFSFAWCPNPTIFD